MRTPGLLRTFGHHFGHGLANELLDHLFPPQPTFAERFLKELPSVLTMAVYVADRFAQKPPQVPVSAAIPSIPRPAPTPCKVLGEFTCPQCKGHTWGWTGEHGRDENGTYIRACSGDIALTMRCGFTWKATDDHLYFAPPTAEDRKRVESVVACVPPDGRPKVRWSPSDPTCASPGGCSAEDEAVQVAISKEWPAETPPPIDVLRMDLVSLRAVIGMRADPQETIVQAAARILTDADAYIAKQAEQIRGLILDNEFAENCGEFSARLSPFDAETIGFPNYAGQVVPVVINDGRWSVRLGANLYPVRAAEPARESPVLGTGEVLHWATSALAREARRAPVVVGGPTVLLSEDAADLAKAGALNKQVGGPVKIDETAQNAAGGVA